MYVLLGYGCQGCSAGGGLWCTTEHESASTGIGLDPLHLYVHVLCTKLQLFGRAGRGGMASRTHEFFSSRQQKCDKRVKEFCTSKENCRRTMMLQAPGVTESHPLTLPCCDVCDNRACPQSLIFTDMTSINARHKGRTAVRVIDGNCKSEFKAVLLREVDMYTEEHPDYQMLEGILCVLAWLRRFALRLVSLTLLMTEALYCCVLSLKCLFLMLSVILLPMHLHPRKRMYV